MSLRSNRLGSRIARAIRSRGIGAGCFREAAGALLDLVYPRTCVSCDEPVEENSPFRFVCELCSRQIRFARQPACRTCGYPFFGAIEEEDLGCERCAELTPLFGEGRTTVLLQGPARDLVHELKYRGQEFLVWDIRRILRDASGLADYLEGAWLVPVPLHPRKERERGFNQSRLLARELASIAPVAGIVEPLYRGIDTESQTRFDRRTRQANLKNAFAKKEKSTLNPENRYVLVDDVFTTGATLNACSAALMSGGARRVDVITFGHG